MHLILLCFYKNSYGLIILLKWKITIYCKNHTPPNLSFLASNIIYLSDKGREGDDATLSNKNVIRRGIASRKTGHKNYEMFLAIKRYSISIGYF